MNDNIVKLRERIVELSNDKDETRKLLDELTEEVIDNDNIQSIFHVGRNDIEETKDYEYFSVSRTKQGYVIFFKGGYSVLINDNISTTSSAAQMLIDGVPGDISNEAERQGYEMAINAIEMIFRLPMFIFSNNEATFAAAEIGAQYLLHYQKLSELPTEDSDNKEYNEFIEQLASVIDKLSAGLEKEGKEYEKRMGHGKGKDKD